jgi:hypothetical protein
MGIDFQLDSHQIQYMVVLNPKTRLKSRMKIESPNENYPALVKTLL